MTALETQLLLEFAPHAHIHATPFELRLAEDRGAAPVQVQPVVVPAWTRALAAEEYAPWLDQALIQEQPGCKRIRLYCSEQAASQTRLIVQGGTATSLGRRQAPLMETLVWVRTHAKKLRHFQDHPTVRIIDHTRFYNGRGEPCPLPEFDPATGTFHHPQEITGALVVEYTPGFTLYEIHYDTGETQLPATWFREMKLAWLAGNIHDATIPQVQVIAIGPDRADQLAFSRDFWPPHAATSSGYRSRTKEPFVQQNDGYLYTGSGNPESCWEKCKNKIQPEARLLTQAELEAIRNCVELERNPKFHYVESSRIERTERITALDNPEMYIDVARPVELTMRLQRADGGVCTTRPPTGCCPEIILRFSNHS
ncbi:MAG: hypothetical protein G8237_04940 [Magnetococcales bacterium]|nr:hypothetical protein [Magnetococcales bacterium]NGZ05682.1 hypothetical protein [Magnetococcales bacterium]